MRDYVPEFVGPEGGHFIDGNDLDHIRTVRIWIDADGVKHTRTFITPFSTFVLWNDKADAVIAEVRRRRAAATVASLPRKRRQRIRACE